MRCAVYDDTSLQKHRVNHPGAEYVLTRPLCGRGWVGLGSRGYGHLGDLSGVGGVWTGGLGYSLGGIEGVRFGVYRYGVWMAFG